MITRPSRPVFLNLLQIRLPVSALGSIVHRLSGLLMVLALPALVWLLARSLEGPEGFAAVRALFTGPAGRLLLSLAAWALLYHLLAGIRLMLIDLEIGVERPAYRYSAWGVLLGAPLLALLLIGGLL